MPDSPFMISGRTFRSRLIVGTGKYPSNAVMAQAHEASGADMVTVAVRRVNVTDRSRESLLDYIDTDRMFILPNTAGCYTADEAVRTAHLAHEAGLSNWVKLEVIGDERTLFPDNEALLAATRILVKDGFVVLPYTSDDPVVCRKLEDAGAAAVMPLGGPIGSGLGIQNVNNIRIIREFSRVPVIVDAGVGTASDAALAMELGGDGVFTTAGLKLLNASGVGQLGRDHDHLYSTVLNQIDEGLEGTEHRITLHASPLHPRIVVDESDHLRRFVRIRKLTDHHRPAGTCAVDNDALDATAVAVEQLAN